MAEGRGGRGQARQPATLNGIREGITGGVKFDMGAKKARPGGGTPYDEGPGQGPPIIGVVVRGCFLFWVAIGHK